MTNALRTLALAASLALSPALMCVATAQTQHLPEFEPLPQNRAPPWFAPQGTQQSQPMNPIAAAVEKVQSSCREELRNFCSTVTPGEGRVLLCMQAHEDKLSKACELSLFEASRNIEHAMRRVERIADACWNDIRVHCAETGSVGQCMIDKNAVLSQQCQAVVAAFQRGSQQQSPAPQQPAIGVPIYSSDGTQLGVVTGVQMGPDGKVQAIQADMGSLLGLGSNSVLINPDELNWRGNRIELRMPAEQVRSVLQGQRR
jgi:cysteine rich repeat protein